MSKNIKATIEILEHYHHNGGFYEIPVEIINTVEQELEEQDKEIERLNNIINELEKELKENYKNWMCGARSNGKSVQFGIDSCKRHFYNRLQELKGSGSNE